MNPYPDRSDPELDEPGLSALYRQGATQTPPAELDRRILDQAQAALQPRPEKEGTPGVTPFARGKASRRWLPPWPRLWDWTTRWKWPWGGSGIKDWPRRWGRPKYWNWPPPWPLKGDGRWNWRRLAIPLSSAAGILLTLGLVLRVLDEQSAMQGQGVTGMAPTPLADYQPSQSTQTSQSSQTSPSSPSFPSSPPSKPEREIAAKEVSEEAIGLSAAASLSRAPAPAQAPAMALTDEVPQGFGEFPQLTDESYQADPERWIEDIRQRWSSGRRDEAIRQLAAFRHVHPQYPLPEDLAFIH